MKKLHIFRISIPGIIFFLGITAAISIQPTFADVRIWAAGSTEKIQPDKRSELPHDKIWDESTRIIHLTGVRGEHVPFQVVVTADRENVYGITVKKSHLQNRNEVLPADNIHLYYEHIIKVYTPSGIHGEKGYWPDALVPLTHPFDIRSGGRGRPPELRNQPIWVDITVPENLASGTYTGTVKVSSGRSELGEINIELEVWDITLPKERHFPALMRIGPNDVARMHGLSEDSPEFKELYFRYLEHALDNRIDPRYLLSYGMHGSVENDSYKLEWTDPKTEKFFLDKGLSVFQIDADPPGIPHESGEQPFSESYQRYVKQYIEQVITHAKENGWYDKLGFLCPVDEPRTADEYEAIRRWAQLVHEVDPDADFMVTEQPLPEDPEWGSFVGYANYWIIHGSYLAREEHVQAIKERQEAGEKIIWYISCDQRYPQPNYFIDREAADTRMIAWITWRYKLGGILYWTTTWWREVRDPWIDPVVWKLSECNDPLSGEGSLIYPGNLAKQYTRQENVFGPVSSIRLELFREGQEELELMYMLKEMGGGSVADKIVESICKGIRDFSRDPNDIDEAKERIVREILKRK